jgi:acetyl esterase/lipase
VCLHGGFWRARYGLGYLGHLCAGLAAQGFASWNVEYRRLGDAGGGHPGTGEDVVESVRRLREVGPAHRLDTDRLVLLGHSAGGHLALWAAPLVRPTGVVALAPVSDLAEASRLALSNGVADEYRGAAALSEVSPRHRLPAGVPQWIVHGTDDADVPAAMSRAYVEAARRAGDRAVLLERPGEGHYEPVDPRASAFDAVVGCLHAAFGGR